MSTVYAARFTCDRCGATKVVWSDSPEWIMIDQSHSQVPSGWARRRMHSGRYANTTTEACPDCAEHLAMWVKSTEDWYEARRAHELSLFPPDYDKRVAKWAHDNPKPEAPPWLKNGGTK